MAISETTFADRLQNGQNMQAAIAIFTPAFAPADTTLAPAAFLTFLDGLDTMNTDTGAAVAGYSTEVATRTAMVKDIKDRAGRALAYIKSNEAWKKYLPGIKSLVDKIRDNRPKAPKPPVAAEPPTSQPAKKRNKGEQSFGDIATNFAKLVAALGAVPGYAPPASAITIANLTTASGAYDAQNATMGTLNIQVGLEQGDRADGFVALRAKMKAIKEAVKSQYGSSSAEYAQVKGIDV